VFSNPCGCTIETVGNIKIKLPSSIENTILKRLNVPMDHLLVVNENFQNVAIIFSKGSFDLSKIKKLEGLKLIIGKKGLINIQCHDLSNVITLEVSFDRNEKYFNLLLSKCINAKKLVLYSTVCELHGWIQNESSLGYKEEMASCELTESKSITRPENHFYLCRSV
ncbi:putative LRR containing protein, partial [Trachipleistophora hominis]